MSNTVKILLAATLCLTVSTAVMATDLLGAGATFPYPLYSKMFSEYHKETGVKINYQAIGSGGGVRQMMNRTVDFGASDAFMNNKKLGEAPAEIIHIPITLGAVAITYNLPGVPSLKFDSELISEIFLGNIKKWNHPKIKALNPGSTLPDTRITIVHRSDGSGTTFILSDYLSKVSFKWKKKVGRGKSLNWPVGIGGKGNAGVAGLVKKVPGSIGYVELVYALQNHMSVGQVKNASGNFMTPSLEATSKAANTEIPADTRVSLTNTSAAYGYPISGFTWILLYKDQSYGGRGIKNAKATKKLVKWMITDGQRFTTPLGYAPLPAPAVKKAKLLLNGMSYKGSPL